MLDVALVGTGGMMPLPNRYLTALLCRLNGSMLLIDCGEGTQMSLKLLGWGYKNIDAICFTHYHADHISGLPGLLLTISNAGREEPLRLIGPPGLRQVVRGLLVIAPELMFPIDIIEITEIDRQRPGLDLNGYKISTLGLSHRIPCLGYSLYVPRLGKFDIERAKALNLPVRCWNRLQHGETVEYEGAVYTSDMVMGGARKGIKVSYITDTRPTPEIPEFIEGSDLFICEGLYGENDKLEKAIGHRHMIFSEAATLAKRGGVRELWLTHYSPAMPDPREFIRSATEIFPNSKTARDRMHRTIAFEDDEE